MKAGSPRAIALQLMLSVLEQGRSLDDLLRSEAFLSQPLSPRDRAFVRELVYGQCRWYFVLQALLQSRLKKPLRDRDRDIECILLAGLYQLLLMRTEAHAAVNESVKLTLARKKSCASRLDGRESAPDNRTASKRSARARSGSPCLRYASARV